MYMNSKNMLYVVTIVSKHCKKMEHSYKKHPRDHENKNVMFIHRSKYMSFIVLSCLVTTIFCLPLYFYYSLPLPLQTFRSLRLCHYGWSLSLANKCVDNRTQQFLPNIGDMFSLVWLQLSSTNKLPSFDKVFTKTFTTTHYSLFHKH